MPQPGVVLRSFIDIRRREAEPALLFFAFWFLVIVIFWILKPLKTGLFIENLGAHTELYAKLANIGIAILAVWIFSWLYSQLGSRRLLLSLCALFMVCLTYFALVLARAATPPRLQIWGFYLLGDAWTTIWVTTFWAYLNEMTTTEQSKRLYGFIGGGGIIGGLVGTTVVATTVERAGAPALLVVAVAGTAVIGVLAWRIERLAASPQSPIGRGLRQDVIIQTGGKKVNEALAGARLALTSRYLLAIVLIVLLYEFVSQMLDYQFKTALQSISGEAATEAFYARVGVIINGLSVITQFFLVSFIIRTFGITKALLVLPAALLISSSIYVAVPTLWAASLLTISDNALNYSINQTSRETLYVPTPAEVKYKARAFTNMFVQRLGKGGAIAVALALPMIPVRYLTFLAGAVILAWAALAIYAGKRFDARTGDGGEESS
jgi:AAA family ATP:ADP antiporter